MNCEGCGGKWVWTNLGYGVLTQNLHGETEENHKKLQSGYLVYRLGF